MGLMSLHNRRVGQFDSPDIGRTGRGFTILPAPLSMD
jgi:hypothetical protein